VPRERQSPQSKAGRGFRGHEDDPAKHAKRRRSATRIFRDASKLLIHND
jgi:hypothetical protein